MSEQSPAWHSWEPGVQMTTLDDAQLTALVHRFYDKIRLHEELGPIFEAKLAGQWGPHLDKMVDFWSTMMTGSKRYDGRPLPVHIGLPDLQDHHFTQWLVLFRETASELFTPALAAQFIERAERMAQSFRVAIAIHEGRWTPGG